MKRRRNWINHIVMTAVCSLLWPLLAAGQNPVFEAYADARQVLLHSYFEVSFTLKDGDGSNFRPPAFDDFKIVAGPSRSVSTTIINGAVSKEMSYAYTLQPTRLGKFAIGPAAITVGNRDLRTRPLSVEVVEGKTDAAASGGGEVFVRAEPSTTEAYLGQQVILSYRLYTTVNIDNYNVMEESEYAGFYAEDIRRIDTRVQREVIGGKQYATKLLRQIALYPQQTGSLTVDPMQIQMGVVADDPGRRGGFFFNRQVRRVPVQTDPITIQVRPLPGDAPASFTGAVGRYQMSAEVNRRELTTDDVLQVTMKISGDGDIKRVQAPDLELPDVFERYDPKVLDESRYESGESIIGNKVIEYLALPKEAGEYEVRPSFSYFNPDSARYVTLTAGPYAVRIEPGSARPRRPSSAEESAGAEPADIKYLKLEEKIYRGDRRFFGSALFWALTILPFLLLGAAVTYKNRLARRAAMDPFLLRTKRARKVALKRLQIAEKHLKARESRAFYDEISKAMLGYVCDKLRIPRSELTKENVRSKLQALGVADDLTENFMHIIRNTEMALFAGMDNAGAMEETYGKTVEVLTRIEEAVGLR